MLEWIVLVDDCHYVLGKVFSGENGPSSIVRYSSESSVEQPNIPNKVVKIEVAM
jgi:hypothetical protein